MFPALAGGFFTFPDFFWWCLLQSVFDNFLSFLATVLLIIFFLCVTRKKDYSYTEIWRDYFESPCTCYLGISMMAQQVKNPPAMQETQVQSLVWKDPLAWKFPWTEEPGRLQSVGFQRVAHNWAADACMHGPVTWLKKRKCYIADKLLFSILITFSASSSGMNHCPEFGACHSFTLSVVQFSSRLWDLWSFLDLCL